VAVRGSYAYVADGYWGLAILDLTPRPQVTSIAWTNGIAIVSYTNTLAGTNYTLEYCTDLRLRNWQPVATQPASGPSATQTDYAAGDRQRYYRVYYRP
jgi:uncharacterized protein YvpB